MFDIERKDAAVRTIGPRVEITLRRPAPLSGSERARDAENSISTWALLDTGSSNSTVSTRLLQRMDLHPVDRAPVRTINQEQQLPEHLVGIEFSNGRVLELVVFGGEINEDHYECILGRDVLAHAVLMYNGPANSFSLSFPTHPKG